MKKLKAALVGAGNRGQIYCDYSLKQPEELEIVAVVDINPFKMNEAADKYQVRDEMRFTDLDAFLAKNVECDFIVNATMDEMHYETAMKIINAGYNLILEKPVTGDLDELKDIEKAAKAKNVKVLVCHVLRYTPYYRTIKEIIDSGKIGKVVSMQLNEHVWYGHCVNAYVRGKWRSEKLCGSGMLLAKCCHDTDLMCWFNNASVPTKVSSFGSRSFYVPENAPEGATKYCYECPHKDTCMFNAHKFEIEKDFMPFLTWSKLNKPYDQITYEEKVEFLKHDPYGQCVYMVDDADIVDRQCVSVEFANGAIGTLNMITGASGGRHIHLVGEYGEVFGFVEQNKFVLNLFDTKEITAYEEEIDFNKIQTLDAQTSVLGHYGGDYNLMKDAVRYFAGEGESVSVTKIDDSINGHLVVYAAEMSRKEGKIVHINDLK